MRRILGTVTLLALSGGSLSAHHSYANYDREHPITIEGQVETIQFVNPHVVLWIRTADSTVYTAVWVGASGAARLGVTASTLKSGDHLIVNGIPRARSHDQRAVRASSPAPQRSFGVAGVSRPPVRRSANDQRSGHIRRMAVLYLRSHPPPRRRVAGGVTGSDESRGTNTIRGGPTARTQIVRMSAPARAEASVRRRCSRFVKRSAENAVARELRTPPSVGSSNGGRYGSPFHT